MSVTSTNNEQKHDNLSDPLDLLHEENVRLGLYDGVYDLSIKSDLKPTNSGELEACVKSFFEDYLNIRECSDAGRMWAPIAISCARAMKLEPLGILIERMRVLSGAEKAHDE
jgi:hypothetical protein